MRALGLAGLVLSVAASLARAGCAPASTKTVKKAVTGGADFATIQAAVDGITPTTMTGDWCIYVDSGSFNEQVDVKAPINTNGFRLYMMSDPAML